MSAQAITDALRGLATGDLDPPRPWAHLSHVGIRYVSDVAFMENTFVDEAGFELTLQDGSVYLIRVQRVS